MPSASPELLRALALLLDEALELTLEARVAWLARARRLNRQLADEVGRLLEAESRLDAEGFLERRHGDWLAPVDAALPHGDSS